MTIRTTQYEILRVALCLVVPLFTACTNEGSTLPLVTPNESVTIPVTYNLDNNSRIPVEKLALKLISNIGDTLLDTVFVPVVGNDSSLSFQDSLPGLRSLRWWNITASALDSGGREVGSAVAGPFASRASRGHVSPDSVFLDFQIIADGVNMKIRDTAL